MKKFVIALVVLLNTFTASAQEPMRFSATVETTAKSIVETSFDSHAEGILLDGQRWHPSEQVMNIVAQPTEKLAVVVRFTLSGVVENAPKSVDAETGILHNNDTVRAYAGESKHFEVNAAYNVAQYKAAHIEVVGGYMTYILGHRYENFYPTSFDGSGYITTYNERTAYRGFEVGARSHVKFGHVELAPQFIFYPHISRHFNSHQNYFGQVFDNNYGLPGRTMGFLAAGQISYELNKHLRATVLPSFQRFRTGGSMEFAGLATSYLTTRSIVAGLELGF